LLADELFLSFSLFTLTFQKCFPKDEIFGLPIFCTNVVLGLFFSAFFFSTVTSLNSALPPLFYFILYIVTIRVSFSPTFYASYLKPIGTKFIAFNEAKPIF